MVRVAFVYPNARAELARAVRAGSAPDSTLLGQNHLGELGLAAEIHDPPPLGRRRFARLRWHLRELLLPWQVKEFDVVFTPLANILPLLARAARGPRTVVVNYGLCTIFDRSSRLRRELLGAALRSAAAVVCLGESQRERLIEQAGLPPERVHTIPLGIDERYFSPRDGALAAEPYVLAVGKDLARDYRTFVEAVRDLPVRVEIAAYPRNLQGLRLPENVRARAVPIGELRDLYAGAACVVVPQRADGYPFGSEGGGLTALLESMAMAKPTVLTDRAIMRDYVRPQRNALVVPPEDPAPLREALERVLGGPRSAASLGAAARRDVEESFTTRRFAERLAPILLGAAQRR